MEIREFANGNCQIWHGNKVLRPVELEWFGEHQAKHRFMFYDTLKAAQDAVKEYREYKRGLQCIKVHEV